MAPRTTAQFEEIRKERREEILAVALELFAEEGYHSTSVSRIAKKADISKGLMYNYFQSKEEVLQTLMYDLFEYAMDLLKLQPGQTIDDDRFEEIIGLSIQIPLEEPHRWKLYMSLVFQKDVTEMLLEQMKDKMGPYMMAMSTYFQGKGHDDPVAMMRIFSALLDGIQMHCLLDPENFPAEQAKHFLIDQFIKR